jgi:hypothetical protein
MRLSTKTLRFSFFSSIIGLIGVGVAQADPALDPLAVGGLNAKVVADQTSESGLSYIDNGNGFYDAAFIAYSTLLPPAGQGGPPSATQAMGVFPTLTATGKSGNVYDFAPSSGNDALQGAGTLTFNAAATGLSAIDLLGTSGNGASTMDYTLNFVDGAVTPLTGTITFLDWGYNAGNDDIDGLGRISNGGGVYDNGNVNNFGLNDQQIIIPLADQSQTLASITLAYDAGTATYHSNLFAISGVAAAPEPSTWVFLLLGAAALVPAVRRRICVS